jgi:hypothetical protein
VAMTPPPRLGPVEWSADTAPERLAAAPSQARGDLVTWSALGPHGIGNRWSSAGMSGHGRRVRIAGHGTLTATTPDDEAASHRVRIPPDRSPKHRGDRLLRICCATWLWFRSHQVSQAAARRSGSTSGCVTDRRPTQPYASDPSAAPGQVRFTHCRLLGSCGVVQAWRSEGG